VLEAERHFRRVASYRDTQAGHGIASLERIFAEAGVGTAEEIERIRGEGGLGLSVRSVVALDRTAAKRAFDAFIGAESSRLINMSSST
jgi:hypothetical protein